MHATCSTHVQRPAFRALAQTLAMLEREYRGRIRRESALTSLDSTTMLTIMTSTRFRRSVGWLITAIC